MTRDRDLGALATALCALLLASEVAVLVPLLYLIGLLITS